MNEPLKIISLGAGVQSTTMLLMSLYGDLPRVEHAIFADTQDEPAEVYRHLDKLEAECVKYGVTLHRVTKGRLMDEIPAHMAKYPGSEDCQFTTIPSFGKAGGLGQRRCTKFYKIIPIRRKVRELSHGDFVEQWIGISLDEVHRMKESGVQYIKHRWPLIELRLNRHDCKRWLKAKNWEATKSACYYCPFHDDAGWARIKAMPKEWSATVKLDRFLNTHGEYLHRSLKPIDQVDFSTEEERGQGSLFGSECSGLCGV